MKSNHWQRKRDIEKGIIRVTKQVKTIEFSYKGNFYKYEFVANSNSGFAYIYKGNEKIYGPYDHEITDLGKEIYNQLQKQIFKN